MPTWKRIAHSLVVLLLLTVPLLARANPFEHTLSNGLRIIVKEDRRAPTAAHMVWYRAGGMDEVSGTTGVAHVLEHMMFKGTPNVGAGEFSRRVAAAGGRDNAFTSKDYTAYFQQVPKAQLAQRQILTMLTTGLAIRSGRVYSNLRVDLQATSPRWTERQIAIVMTATDCSRSEAKAALASCNQHVRTAILMLMAGLDAWQARDRLAENNDRLRLALQETAPSSLSRVN